MRWASAWPVPGTFKALKCSYSDCFKYYYYHCQCCGYCQNDCYKDEDGGDENEIRAGRVSGPSPHCSLQYRPKDGLQLVLEPAGMVCDVHAFFSGVESIAVIVGLTGSATLKLLSLTHLKSRVSWASATLPQLFNAFLEIHPLSVSKLKTF